MTRRAQAYRPLRRSDELLARVMLAGPVLAVFRRAVVEFDAA
jgi:hypothetical protein